MPQRGFDIVGPSGRAPGGWYSSEFAEIEAMSRAELIEFILATLESGELALDRKPESPPLLEASKMGLV
jgi:hypothetical protein